MATIAQPSRSAGSNAGTLANGASSSDGAQPGMTPVVPWVHATTGRGVAAGAAGTTTIALAIAGAPASRVVVYRIRHACAPAGTPRMNGSLRSSAPGRAGTSSGGA